MSSNNGTNPQATPPADEPILQFFAYHHLPDTLREVSKPFGYLAHQLVAALPRNAERSTALRKLLEAKDAAVRAVLFKATDAPRPPTVVDAELRERVEVEIANVRAALDLVKQELAQLAARGGQS